jgi:transcriptional regulator with XRE-family HTH domain
MDLDPRARTALAHIAANIRSRRVELDKTQEQLASEAGIHKTYVQRLEQGNENVSVGVLVRIAGALDISVEALFRPARLEPRGRGRPPSRSSLRPGRVKKRSR